MRTFAIALAAVLVTGLQAAHAAPGLSTCTVQYAQRSEPSTDDSIGQCLDKMLILSIYDGANKPKLVDEISYVFKTAATNCNENEFRRTQAIELLKAEAAALKAQGQCTQVELLL